MRRQTRLTLGSSLGPYTVERILSCGRIFWVAQARAPDGRQVLVKTPRDAGNESAVGLLYSEMLMLLQNDIAGVRGGIEMVAQPPTQVLEWIEGASVAAYLAAMAQKGHAFDRRAALMVVHGLLETLRILREQGIAHGDIGPDNVIISRSGRPMLIDFTFGYWPTRVFVRPLQFMPKRAAYCCQAHHEGEYPSPQSDMFALGALLQELLQNEVSDDALGELIAAMRHADALQRPLADAALVAYVAQLLGEGPVRR